MYQFITEENIRKGNLVVDIFDPSIEKLSTFLSDFSNIKLHILQSRDMEDLEFTMESISTFFQLFLEFLDIFNMNQDDLELLPENYYESMKQLEDFLVTKNKRALKYIKDLLFVEYEEYEDFDEI